MEALRFQGRCLKRYSVEENFSLDDSAYVIQQVESHDALRVEALRQQGFCFHKRFFFVEASLKAADIICGQVHRDLPGIILELSYESSLSFGSQSY